MDYTLRKFNSSGNQETLLKGVPRVKVGDTVKLVFELIKPASDKEGNLIHAERMWVQVTKVSEDVLKGSLDNDPIYLNTVKSGDEIKFTEENIFDVWTD